MPIVRTTCPTCDVVTVDAPKLRVRLGAADDVSEAIFVCPACQALVIHPVNEHMLPVLIGAGCPIEPTEEPRTLGERYQPAAHPAFGPELSELEIEQFVSAMDRADWFDELAF